jgi:hypothetical protein
METDGNQSNMEFMKNCLDILRIDNEYIVKAREERDNYREMYQKTYDDLVDTTKKISKLTSQIDAESSGNAFACFIMPLLLVAILGSVISLQYRICYKLDTIQTQIKAIENNEHTK